MKNLKYALETDTFEIRAKLIKSTDDIVNNYSFVDADPQTIQVFDDEKEALEELKQHECYVKGKYSTPSGSIYAGKVYYVEEYEAGEDGEFISGSNFCFAEFDTTSQEKFVEDCEND